ncbi:MAG: cation transporting ATPase C-terminal domain-containing protein [Desulfurococcaceae archaeon]
MCFGPLSSLFDYITFFTILYIFKASESLFQTAGFIESLTSQTLVVLVIRTTRFPFWRSRPSRLLIFTTIVITVSALILPYTLLGKIFRFVEPPVAFYPALLIILSTYLILTDIIRHWFYKKYKVSHRVNALIFSLDLPLSLFSMALSQIRTQLRLSQLVDIQLSREILGNITFRSTLESSLKIERRNESLGTILLEDPY